ncbi:UbiA family prenyltransferase [Amycolatopsis pithecellobii]|uniref:Ubiquinone biosynthesis protein UbiA n=1 Tax=Amycolatopsis pithecellobii TaxID=664692 RepID=A0A6N7YSH3_9PSEU|nr:UbiA family prenyltransferase [Amycolatopsis pithecellobii]MTD54888.1 hypothetical protein [Amycolatopsis pithecellobii]
MRVEQSFRRQFTRSVAAYMTLLRVRSCLSAGLLFVLGALSRAGAVSLAHLAIGAAAVCFAVAQANVVNDIVDRRVDAIDQPWRPLPGGTISLRSAWVSYVVCCASTGCLGWLASPDLGLWAIVMVALSGVYSWWLKSTVLLGNIVIGLMATSPLLIGARLATGLGGELAVKALAICVSMWSFEVVKTARDAHGDAAGGLRTVATRLGVDRAVRLGIRLCEFAGVPAAGAAFLSPQGAAFGVVFVVFVVFPIVRFYHREMLVSSTFSASDAMNLFAVMSRTWKFGFLALAVSVVDIDL